MWKKREKNFQKFLKMSCKIFFKIIIIINFFIFHPTFVIADVEQLEKCFLNPDDEICKNLLQADDEMKKKEIEAANEKIDNITRKLENKGFLAKAPENVVLLNKRRLTEETAHKKILDAALSRIKDAD